MMRVRALTPLGVCALLALGSALADGGLAQETVESGPGLYHLADNPEALIPGVAFLNEAPVIDGVLDEGLETLLTGGFSEVIVDGRGSEMESADRVCVTAALPTYRLAYGTDFFYIYVEAPGERLHFRDRAYQNGDGFSLMLGAVRPDDAPTDEFYVLSCSAVDDARMEWSRRIFWYYNVDDIFLRTSPETRLEFQASGGVISFELYLPWSDIHPHHPWFSDRIGFNLRFVKAVGEGVRYKYIVVPDEIGAEYRNRLYGRLDFEEPHVEGPPQSFFLPGRNNIREGERLRGVAVTASKEPCEEEMNLRVKAGFLKAGVGTHALYACSAGLTRHELELDTSGLKSGGYELDWSAKQGVSKGRGRLTVLPDHDFDSMDARLERANGRVAPGSITTIQWAIEDLSERFEEVRPYETCEDEREALGVILDRIAAVERGEDPYAARTGFFRRAYRSKLDDSLQPYAVIIPDDLDRSRSYPLVVFLHGSASDETNIGGFMDIVPPGYIGLGPRGRGPSNLFCFDHAQKDIAEAIEDVIANYPIDTDRIILTGFSMGGYGVYRTFYETPEKFRALAVFSGTPFGGHGQDVPCERDAGQKDRAADLPEGAVAVLDFRCAENLKPFDGTPMFIHHGEKDQNCSYHTMVEEVELLRAAGAQVEFISDPELGHQAPSSQTYHAYHRWLASVLE